MNPELKKLLPHNFTLQSDVTITDGAALIFQPVQSLSFQKLLFIPQNLGRSKCQFAQFGLERREVGKHLHANSIPQKRRIRIRRILSEGNLILLRKSHEIRLWDVQQRSNEL